MTLEAAADLVAETLKRLCKEHGRPHSFSCLDIERAGGPYHLLTGRIGTSYRVEVWTRLGGAAGWGSCPTYANGRFFV